MKLFLFSYAVVDLLSVVWVFVYTFLGQMPASVNLRGKNAKELQYQVHLAVYLQEYYTSLCREG